ncbi:50S ribosomal protein L19 [Candidatus Dependentiae bacterium]|nr:MAG: 50S ribosomal protein L19 [Candidatus Dependentiae bacterium]
MQAKKITKETVAQFGMIDRKFPEFNVGDTLAVVQRVRERIKEGDKESIKERLQTFEGDVIAIRKNGVSSTFTIRKIGAHNIPVERIFPFCTPIIEDIKVIRLGEVRRAKLYYLRDRVGKAAKIKEKIIKSRG